MPNDYILVLLLHSDFLIKGFSIRCDDNSEVAYSFGPRWLLVFTFWRKLS